MASIGTYVIYIIMACAIVGAIASIIDNESPLGREFLAGINSIGPIFLPVAGIMASIPYLSRFVVEVTGPLFASLHADPAIAATSVIAVDMGGYQLAKSVASSPDGWILASLVGFMAGATIIFSIPVGIALLDKRDHKYMALGVMSGVLSIPIGVAAAAICVMLMEIPVRPDVATSGDATHQTAFTVAMLTRNLSPLVAFCLSLALALRFAPKLMIQLFLAFGRVLYGAITLVFVCSVVEYFTGAFSHLLGGWGFAPIIANAEDQFRGLEIAGYIGIMLSGAFPMVYLITHFLSRPIEAIGRRIGMSAVGAAGLLAASANILAMFRLIREMPPKDKVLAIAYAVCAGFMFGDHLAFSANFQPTIILPLLIGKFTGGVSGFLIAMRLSVPRAIALEEEEPPAEHLTSAAYGNI